MQRLEVRGAVRLIYKSLGVKRLIRTYLFFFFTFAPCVLILSKVYLFTNWCTSELS